VADFTPAKLFRGIYFSSVTIRQNNQTQADVRPKMPFPLKRASPLLRSQTAAFTITANVAITIVRLKKPLFKKAF